jgi:hypothetical protein
MSYVSDAIGKIREINRRYAQPKIRLTRSTKVILMVLRIYLLSLVGLLVYALVTRAH